MTDSFFPTQRLWTLTTRVLDRNNIVAVGSGRVPRLSQHPPKHRTVSVLEGLKAIGDSWEVDCVVDGAVGGWVPRIPWDGPDDSSSET